MTFVRIFLRQYYSQYTEAYTVPGDVRTKGADFLAEAERHLQSHQFEKGGDIRLASLQAHLLLYERYAGSQSWAAHALIRRLVDLTVFFSNPLDTPCPATMIGVTLCYTAPLKWESRWAS